MDRGGLKHVNHTTYALFLSMEMKLREYLVPGCAMETSGVKDVAMEAVKEDEDVMFYWSVISCD